MCNPLSEVGKILGTEVSTPKMSDYGQQLQDALQAQIRVMPDLLAAEQKYGGQMTDVNLANMQRYLMGSNGQMGMLDMYRQGIGPALSGIEADTNRAQRTADIEDVTALGPGAWEASRGYNPQQTELMDILNEQALQQAALGGMMDPDQRRLIEQQWMGQRSGMGWGYNPGDMAQAAMRASGYSDQLREQRQQMGMRTAGLNQAVYGDPYMQVLGRPGQTFGAMQGMGAMGQAGAANIGPTLFQPESQMMADLLSTQYTGKLGANVAQASNRAGMVQGGLSMLGSLGGAGIMAA